jgi:hypothetical protein
MKRRHLVPRGSLAVVLSTVVIFAASGCGAGTPASVPVPVLGAHIVNVRAGEADALIRRAWASSPGLSTYSIQQVSYTAKSRDNVLAVCQHGGAATDFAALQSDKLLACAPLIFFLYSYGHRHAAEPVNDAATALYNFAVTHVIGPTDAEAWLNKTLKTWGLSVASGPMPHDAPNDPTSLLERQVLAMYSSMRQASGVVVSIAQQTASHPGVLRTTAALGAAGSLTTFQNGPAHATILIVGTRLYVSDSNQGLVGLLRVPSRIVKRANGAPIEIGPGDPPYAALSTANGLAALPAQVLPATDAVGVSPGPEQAGGEKLQEFTWVTHATATSPSVTHTLIVRDSSVPLPVASLLSAGGLRETAHFMNRGRQVSVRAPERAVAYSALTKN